MAETPEDAPEIDAGNQDVTALNEELIDRLRILNYQKEFVSKGNKPINLATFSVATNPTDQFNIFKKIVSYLLQLNDVKADYSQYDQPMTVSGNIIKQCQKLQIPCEFPPLKLKPGSGQQVLLVLNGLAGKAMKKKNFNFKKPSYEKATDVEQQKEEQEKPGDDGQQMIDDVDVAEDDDLDDKEQVGAAVLDEEKQIIHSNVSENDWKLECERVANKLKIQSKADNKEWRARIQSTRSSTDFVKKNFPSARSILEKLNDELTSTLDKISKSERMINSSMSDIGDQYKSQSEQLKKLSSHFTNLSTAMKQMNENYRLISEKLQQIQAKTNQHSGTMTDTSPVVKIKEALKNMQTEIKSMDVRLGVLNHTVLQYKSKERNQDKKLRNLEADEFVDDLQ